MATVNWNALEGSVLDGLFAAEGMAVDVGERYELGDELGKGDKARSMPPLIVSLNRQVAIKVAHNASASRLLQAEAGLLARLTHPAIPAVYDSGKGADGRAFMVMELVEGQPLYRLLRQSGRSQRFARACALFALLLGLWPTPINTVFYIGIVSPPISWCAKTANPFSSTGAWQPPVTRGQFAGHRVMPLLSN